MLEKKFLEGSQAIAEIVALCEPAVISAYPITPQTHIVEELANLKANGKLKAEYMYAESEFAAASIVLGASATGSRTYTATTSQGLLLMTEVVFSIAGMRLPVVMTVANRSIGAPLNIWNDTQDTVTVRDAGWINIFAENLDEAVLMHIAAFRIGEKLNLPVIVNVDGFVLTHTAEVVQMPTPELVQKLLPKRKATDILDPENPRSLGTYALPAHYHLFREKMHADLVNSQDELRKVFKELHGVNPDFSENLVEGYRLDDAEMAFVTVGSLMGTVRETVDELRADGMKIGAVKIKSLRPFADDEVREVCVQIPRLMILDKNISLGTEGILATEMRRALFGSETRIEAFTIGLGGKDITREELKKIAQGEFDEKNVNFSI